MSTSRQYPLVDYFLSFSVTCLLNNNINRAQYHSGHIGVPNNRNIFQKKITRFTKERNFIVREHRYGSHIDNNRHLERKLNMHGYLPADIICSEKRTRKLRASTEQIMFKDKYPCIFVKPNDCYCVYYPSNIFSQGRSVRENWPSC